MRIINRTLTGFLAIAILAGLGCTKRLQVRVPDSFHGRVQIVCGDIVSDKDNVLRVDASGEIAGVSCPSRREKLLVTRENGSPLEVNELWLTTGDGFVRQVSFDVP